MKVLTNLDFNKNEIQNVRLQQLSADPSASQLVSGMIWMNTSSSPYVVKYYNGSEIITLGALNFETSSSNIKMDGTASVGSLSTVARADHIHPSDTSRVPTSRTINGKALTANIAITPYDLDFDSTAGDNVGDLLDEIGNAAYKGVDTSIASGSTSTNLPTTAAVVNYVASAVGAVDAMRFKGTIGTGGTVTSLPTSNVKVGDTYRVITAGTYASQECEVGDLIIATATTPTWTVAQTNIDGAITSISSGTGISVTGSGSSRTVGLTSTISNTIDRLAGIEVVACSNMEWTPSTGGMYTCTIQHGYPYAMVDVYDNDTGLKVITDITHNHTNNNSTVKIIASSAPAKSKYSAIVLGLTPSSFIQW